MSREPDRCPVDLDLVAFRSVSYGLYTVCTRAGDRRNGCLVNTFAQIAEEPCIVSVSLSKKNLTHDMVGESGVFSVQVLEQDTPLRFIGGFGFRSGRDTDKLSGVKHREGVTGCPVVLEHTIASFEVEVSRQVDCGTHTLFIGRAVKSERLKEGDPLTYSYYQQVKGGKTGRNAPGYRVSVAADETNQAKRSGEMKKYVCTACGYVYDPAAGDPDSGVEPGTPFEKLPEDWVCPVCGAAKDMFEPQD